MHNPMNDRRSRAELSGWQRQIQTMTDDELRQVATAGDPQSPLSRWLAAQPDSVLAAVAVGTYAGFIPS